MKARTRKFSRGGDIAAGLVGLGTLGYLLSKKKDKEPEDKGTMSSIGEKSDVADRILSGAGKSMADSAEERQRKANMGEPEESDIQKAVGKPLPATTTPTTPSEPVKVSKPTIRSASPVSASTPKPKVAPAAKPEVPKLKPGESKVVGEGKLKPYPKDVKPAEKSKPVPEKKPAAKTSSSGMGPKNTFLTKERLDKSKEAMKRARQGYKAGGTVSSASKRADGCAMRGKTRGRVL